MIHTIEERNLYPHVHTAYTVSNSPVIKTNAAMYYINVIINYQLYFNENMYFTHAKTVRCTHCLHIKWLMVNALNTISL